MTDIKQKLQEIEDQVSSIKDPVLKKLAFEKLLEKSLGTGTSNKTSGQIIKKQKNAKGKSSSTSLFYSESQVRPEVQKMHVTGTLQGFPSFKSCGSKKDAYLWILVLAKNNKIDGLNTHEIAYIMSKKLYKPTKYSTVYGIRNKVSEGLVILDPGTDNWKITPDGEDYLRSLLTKDKK
jgi:hypothetical protein